MDELSELHDEALALCAKLNAAIERSYEQPGASHVRAKLYEIRSHTSQAIRELHSLLPALPRAGEDN